MREREKEREKTKEAEEDKQQIFRKWTDERYSVSGD